jgi:hypothetical protein
MDTGIQSSFIPKDASASSSLPRRRDSGGLSEVIFLISIVLLVASAALGGAVFLYAQYVQSSSVSKVDQLQRAKAAFEPSLISELTRLDDRMSAADSILANHVAPSAFFSALDQTTLATVSFQSLTFQAPDVQHMSIKMTGIAEGVNSIALEGDILSKSGVIANPIFTDISRQTDGVHFSLSASINPAAINYVNLVNSGQGAAAAAAVQTPSAAQSGLFGGSSAGSTQPPATTQAQGTSASSGATSQQGPAGAQ